LYSTIFGAVTFKKICDDEEYPIVVEGGGFSRVYFTGDGKYYNYDEAECILFPSKDNQDWSTFKTEQPQFKPFEKVLVRNHNGQAWKISLYSYFSRDFANPHACIEDCYNQCIPYEGNEHLLGTTDEPKGKEG